MSGDDALLQQTIDALSEDVERSDQYRLRAEAAESALHEATTLLAETRGALDYIAAEGDNASGRAAGALDDRIGRFLAEHPAPSEKEG